MIKLSFSMYADIIQTKKKKTSRHKERRLFILSLQKPVWSKNSHFVKTSSATLPSGCDLVFPWKYFPKPLFLKGQPMVISNNIQPSGGKWTHWPRHCAGEVTYLMDVASLLKKQQITQRAASQNNQITTATINKSRITNYEKCVYGKKSTVWKDVAL